jgi:hypothetical protein
MVAKTSPRVSAGHHWRHVKRWIRGRASGSSTARATNWRTATTPAGPITGNAWRPSPAPTWLLVPLASIVSTPVTVFLLSSSTVAGTGRVAAVMSRVCGPASHPQNA